MLGFVLTGDLLFFPQEKKAKELGTPPISR